MQTLTHVLWIGGPPGAGKTSVALRIARRHGLRWYGADTRTWEHRDRALASGNAAAGRWEAMPPAERWARPAPELLEMSLHSERGAMAVDDLRALPPAPLTIAEGTVLPAWAVSSGIAVRTRSVWLLVDPAFQRSALAAKGVEPDRMALSVVLAETIEREAAAHAVPTLRVDGSCDLEAVVAAVERRFADALAAGPRAETRAERRALMREANLAVAEQVRGYHARAWARGDAGAVVCELVCECGAPDCTAVVHAPIAAVRSGPVLAPGHS